MRPVRRGFWGMLFYAAVWLGLLAYLGASLPAAVDAAETGGAGICAPPTVEAN